MRKITLTENRDVPLLKFLWRWKLASTATLTQKFFAKLKPKTAYDRLLALKKSGFIRTRSDQSEAKYLWTLDKAGFQAIRDTLPFLESEGYQSEHIGHDLLVSAVHIGDWLLRVPDKVEVFSEQELRTVHPDHYPTWLPHPATHRPDGYWRLPIGEKMATIALEVELNLKRNVDYEILGDFYAYHPEIIRTLWVTEDLTAAKKITHNIKQAIGSKPFTHDFVSLHDFKKSMWQSLILIGPEKDKSIARLLQIKNGTSVETFLPYFLLDTRKCAHKSNGYKLFSKGDFSK